MRPVALRLLNVGPWADETFLFEDGVTAFVGANGSGKSTVLNALEAALFADGARDLAPMLGPRGDRLMVELTFEHDRDTYRVRRTFNGRRATLDLERDADPITRETTAATQALITETIGLTRPTFNASAFLAQGNAGAFPEAKPADRKARIGEILDPAGTWPALRDTVAAERVALDRDLAVNRARIADLKTRAAGIPEADAKVAELEVSAVAARGSMVEADQALEAARARLAANAADAERVRTVTAERDAARATHTRIVAEWETHRKTAAAESDRAARTLAQHAADAEKLTGRIRDLEHAQDGHERCTLCHQTLGAEARTTTLNHLTADRRRLQALIDTETPAALTLRKAALEAAEPDPRIQDAADALQDAEQALTLAAAGTGDQGLLERVVAAHRDKAAQARALVDKTTADLARARAEHDQKHDAARQLVTVTDQTAGIHDRADLLRLAERCYGRDGVPALIVEAAVPELETETNRILDMLPTQDGGILQVELRTQTALKSDTDRLRETLDVIVSDYDGERAYETYSGGERARLNIGLRVALAVMLARRHGAESRLLALDELEYLDEQGQEALVGVLRDVAGLFDVVLVVSHAPGIRDAFDRTLEVVKTDGVSRIREAA